MNLSLLQEKLSKRERHQRRNDAYEQAATAVVAYHCGFKVEALSLADDEIWIMKSVRMLDVGNLDDEIKPLLAAAVVHCVLKGEKASSKEERSIVESTIARIYHYDRSTSEGRKAAAAMYDDLWGSVLQLLIDPKAWGRVVAMACRLMRDGSLSKKEIESIISEAHPACLIRKLSTTGDPHISSDASAVVPLSDVSSDGRSYQRRRHQCCQRRTQEKGPPHMRRLW